MNVDLPNLTSIDNSDGWSFMTPRSVTLESISEYWILMVFRYSKSSNCHIRYWLSSSIPECSMEINFEYWLIDFISFIDVHWRLADLVPWSNQWFKHWIYTLHSIPLRSMIIVYSMLTLYILFQTPNLHSLVIDLGSNHHRLTLFHHHNPDWFS